MAQSSKTAAKGQRKGKNPNVGVAPPPTNSVPSFSVPSSASGAGSEASNDGKISRAAKQQSQDNKYPLWKYVTKKQGDGAKAKGGGNILWTCGFCHTDFTSTYYRVKGHLLGLPCGLGACKSVSASKKREMAKNDVIGLGKVATTSKKIQNDDPLPFLKKPSSNFKFGSGSATQVTQQARKRGAAGTMDKIFQQEKREEVDLTIGFFFYLNFISFNVARSPLFLEMCRALIDQAPIGYVPPNSEKLRTTLLVKAKKEVDKILQPIKSAWPSTDVSIVFDGVFPSTHHQQHTIHSSTSWCLP